MGRTLQHRYRFNGIEVLKVSRGGLGAAAGLRGKRQQVQAALTVRLLLASMFFPPAMIGAAALGATGIGESQELIIAVDGDRTHDVTEFDAALDQAMPGENAVLDRGQRRSTQADHGGITKRIFASYGRTLKARCQRHQLLREA
jgi:hypothetical protein